MAKITANGDKLVIKLARSRKTLSNHDEKEEVIVTEQGRVLHRVETTTPKGKSIKIGWSLKKTVTTPQAKAKELRSWRGKGFRTVL